MLIATLAATEAVAAPTNAGRGNEDAAKAAFARGLRLSEDGQYEAARIEFERSLELKPTRSAAINRAVCLRHLGRFEEALTAIRSILKEKKSLKRGERIPRAGSFFDGRSVRHAHRRRPS
jgi:tetratricopeptide (TPR) repeat protein